MKNVAFVTYNSVGDSLSSGWHDGPSDRRALVLQRTTGDGASVKLEPGQRSDQISILWGELQKALPELDHIVVYVGANGSQRAIALAGQLPASKISFVGCDCGILQKEAMIQAAGLTEARRLLCECGGHRTMKRLYTHFMETGTLHPSG